MSLLLQADTSAAIQLDALLHRAGVAPLDNIGWMRVTGEDRVRWLNGMVTNSITELAPGAGNYNFILNAQGRIQGDLTAFAEPDALVLRTTASRVPALIALLDRFIIMDDVELADVTPLCAGLVVAGPQAEAVLAAIGLPAVGLHPMHKYASTWRGFFVVTLYPHSPLVPRFELWGHPAIVPALMTALTEAGAEPCTSAALEQLRLLEGTPRYGVDIRDRELPQETNQLHALHFSKGCYLGQEIVERIRSRGAVHRTFGAFRIVGDLPSPGSAIELEGKSIGELTSLAAIPLSTGTLQIALGYIRREALDRPGAQLTCCGAEVIPLPLPVREL